MNTKNCTRKWNTVHRKVLHIDYRIYLGYTKKVKKIWTNHKNIGRNKEQKENIDALLYRT